MGLVDPATQMKRADSWRSSLGLIFGSLTTGIPVLGFIFLLIWVGIGAKRILVQSSTRLMDFVILLATVIAWVGMNYMFGTNIGNANFEAGLMWWMFPSLTVGIGTYILHRRSDIFYVG